MSKILKYLSICFAVLLLAMPAKPDSFDIKIGTGIDVLLGTGKKMEADAGHILRNPIMLSIGYSFGHYRISLEGQVAAFPPLLCYYTSAILDITFTSSQIVRGYSLLGIGYGATVFSNKENGSLDANGPIQIQAGIGVGFKMNDWLELGTDGRLRIGMPSNPDIISFTQHVWVMFKL